MTYALTTGRAARLLGVTEPQLSETVRRGKVRPEPTIHAGRRLWFAEHLLQAAEALSLLDDDLRARIEGAAPASGVAAPAISHLDPRGAIAKSLNSLGAARSSRTDREVGQ